MSRKAALFILIILSIQGASVLANATESKEILDRDITFVESFQNILVDLAERVQPTIVNISPSTETFGGTDPQEAPHESPEGQTPDESGGSGSGIIIDKRGFIVTNNHVVGDSKEVEVGLADKRIFTGKVVAKDLKTDIALIKIEASKDLPAAVLGDSSKVKVGQWAMAVGDPFGLDRTVTVGIISALGRENVSLSPYEDFIQTDAPINPGNSGGPLLNIRGEVIGLNTAIIPSAKGIGFAIPSNTVQSVAGQLIAQGKVTRAWLGIGIQLWTPELANAFHMKEEEGLLVSEVADGGPAGKTGIQPGDVILKLNGHSVESPNSIARLIAGSTPGTTVTIDLLRGEEKKTLTVELAEEKNDMVRVALPKR